MRAALPVSTSAQQIFFPDFSSISSLQRNGSRQAFYSKQYVLRLTNGQLGEPPASTTWFAMPQPVNKGFTTYFRFQIHNAPLCCGPGDGLAFVIQNSSSTDASYGARGAGKTAVGAGNGGLGYAGIPTASPSSLTLRPTPGNRQSKS
jgi:hypothetical protein